jgi:hypothetical protein
VCIYGREYLLGELQVQEAKVIKVDGRLFDNATALRDRLGISEGAIRTYVKAGMPGPVWLGRSRYWNREDVDKWILGTR